MGRSDASLVWQKFGRSALGLGHDVVTQQRRPSNILTLTLASETPLTQPDRSLKESRLQTTTSREYYY